MSLTYSTDVFCDDCGNWTHGCIRVSAITARRVARLEGWKCMKIKNGWLDLCPECAPKRAKARRGAP